MQAAVVTYHCPACQAPLQADRDRPEAWLRCPRCGRGGRSPAPPANPAVPRVQAETVEAADLPPVELVPIERLSRRREAAPERDWRVLYASGLFVSTTLLIFSYLDSNVIGTSVFGTLTFGCAVLLFLSARPRS